MRARATVPIFETAHQHLGDGVKVWTLDGGFGTDHLAPSTRPSPVPGPGQILLRMRAASLNYRDLLMIRGHYNPRQPLPLVPCSDGVGEVIGVGPDVTRFSVGDRACPIFAQAWLGGPPDVAASRSTLGGPVDGTLQERMVVHEHAAVRPPTHLSDEEAACLPCAGVTAWRALATEGGIQAGDTVLTLGTGGVSLFAVQIAKMLGARVVVTSSQDEKLERAIELGADHGINYERDRSWGRSTTSWTGGRGVDLVMELGGAGTLTESLRAVRMGGTVALIGVLAGASGPVPLTRILMRGVRVQGVFVGSRHDFEALNRALTAHPEVRPQVDRVFDFNAVPEALEYLSKGLHMGKVVVRID
ncbi:MAG: NAD(P)-dependent alcohol dehydrogenase [Myxococcota bacterium]|nr:NAD(P)-dependent alcohol dehydrogenase [Myxococcota bacterium]